MKSILVYVILLSVIVCVAGCAPLHPSPFAGDYGGTYTHGNDGGTANVTIAPNGGITGSLFNDATGQASVISSGSIDLAGTTTFSRHYATGDIVDKGRLLFNDKAHTLTGKLDETSATGSPNGMVTMILTRKQAP